MESSQRGSIPPSTTTSSARVELDYNGYNFDGARGDRWSSDGRGGGSSCDASSQRPRQLAARSCEARWSPQVVGGAKTVVAQAAGGPYSLFCRITAVQSAGFGPRNRSALHTAHQREKLGTVGMRISSSSRRRGLSRYSCVLHRGPTLCRILLHSRTGATREGPSRCRRVVCT